MQSHGGSPRAARPARRATGGSRAARLRGLDKELFDNISPASGEVSQGDGSAIQIEGIGTARLRLSEKCGGYTIVLKKAFYIPNLSDNIVSQAELENKGVEFHSKEDSSTAFIDDEVLFTAFKMGKLTWLTLDGVGEEDNEEIRKTLARTTIETWHYKMGHLHEKALKKLPVTMKSKPDSLEHCETCCTTKNKKESYPKNHPCKPKQPLERIHSDLMGKLNPASKGGAEYIATFIDGYSNHVTAIPMKKKSDTLGEFKKYQARVENLHDKKIKEIQTDNGTEYVNSEFKAHLEAGGVLHRKSVKKNPQQNGKAERQNQTLMSTVRSMLKQAGMPKEFWGEALNAACYVRNRSPSAAIGGKIPLELWLDRKLTKEDYENIKVFGCLAYAHVDDAGKFDDKGEKCVFLGYPDGVKGYRLWSMSRNQAIISRDVKFFEKIFPFKQKQKPKQTEQYENYFSTSDESESECEEEKSSADDESESDPEPSGSESDAHSGSDSDTKTSESEQQTTSDEEDGEESGEENGNTEVESEENNTEDEENSEHEETINLHSEDEDQEENQSSSSEEEQVQAPLRRSTRVKKHKANCTLPCCNKVSLGFVDVVEPKTVQEALNGPDKEKWKAAMEAELSQMKKQETWEVVKKKPGKNIVGSKWVFKIKTDREPPVYKARLVAQGYSQIKGLDYEETFSPVIKKKSLRLLLALAVEEGYEARHVDVTSAYLNSPITNEVYMKQPEGYEEQGKPSAKFVCKLKKSIYGLHQAGRDWNSFVDEKLKEVGLSQSYKETCIYYLDELVVGLYVDDMLIIGKKKKIEALLKKLSSFVEFRDLGQVESILSIQVDRESKDVVQLHQSKYIEKVLRDFRVVKKSVSPLPLGPQNEGFCEEKVDSTLYRKIVGHLLYLANGTRPDMSYAVCKLAQSCSDPRRGHWNQVRHLLRYLNHTKDLKLRYIKSNKQVEAYCDSDWAECKDTRRSVSGVVLMMSGGSVVWYARKQTSVAGATLEAEYIAMNECVKDVLWIQDVLEELKLSEYAPRPIKINVDNQGAISLANHNVNSEKSRHFDTRLHHMRDERKKGRLEFHYIPTKKNLADILTKALSGVKTQELAHSLGLH